MSNPLQNRKEYETFLYTLQERFSSIRNSNIVYISKGARLGEVQGEILFDYGFRIVLQERLKYGQSSQIIYWYGYEIWRGSEKLYWYDSQPHPDDKSLASTDPHHKHIHPDIKHHRIPAPQMSFHKPNLPFLIEEIEELIRNKERS